MGKLKRRKKGNSGNHYRRRKLVKPWEKPWEKKQLSLEVIAELHCIVSNKLVIKSISINRRDEFKLKTGRGKFMLRIF